jgi:hypothetical protein
MPRRFSCSVFGLLLFGFFCSFSSACMAQVVTVTPEQQRVCDRHHETLSCPQLVKEFATDRELLGANPSSQIDTPFNFTDAFSHKIAGRALLKQAEIEFRTRASEAAQTALQTISTSAATNQNGGSPTASGSTNLVSKPTTTDFISMAAESGAFTDTINGTTMTLQANALGLTKYFANQPVFQRWESRYADTIQPLTFTATLNVAQTGSSTVPTTGSANATTPVSIGSILVPTNNASFSSFGVNYALYRPYNPQDKKFRQAWEDALTSNQKALDDATSVIQQRTESLIPNILSSTQNTAAELAEWHKAGAEAERAQDFEKFVSAYAKFDNAFADAMLSSAPDAAKNLLDLGKDIDAYNQLVYTVLNKARGTPLATLSYLYSNPQDKPATHSFTAALSYLFKGDDPKKRTPLMGAQLTANFTAEIYASVPAGAQYGRLRDFQLSGEFDKPFGGTPDEPRATWSLAGYGQYQYDPTVLNITAGNLVPGTNIPLPGDAQVLLGTAGWLGVAQGKLTINLKKGLTIPVAVKWSNKTDLLKGDDVRGQVGLSYDLSALGKLISPSK